jgi:hypothetical protein
MSYPPNNPGGQPPYGNPPGQPAGYPPPPPGSGEVGADKATLALIFGIGGIICCPPVAIAAFVMGNNAKKEAESTGRPLNGTINAARILGIVGCVLLALGIVFFVIAAITGGIEFKASTSSS